MNRINSLAIRRPLSFGLVITSILILLLLISSIVAGRLWPADTSGWYFGSTIGRLGSIFILLFIVARLGWLRSAGFVGSGHLRTWITLLLALAYSIVVSAYAMTGNFHFSTPDPVLAGIAVLFLISHAFLEELVFRGLILFVFVRKWGTANRGILMSVLVSSLFFGGYHLLYLAGEPLQIVFLRIVAAFLLGILFGALVLQSGSIYPAAFFHALLNIAGYLNLTSNGAEGTASSWLVLVLFMLPLALYGLYLVRDITRPVDRSDHALRTEYPVR